MKALAPKLSIFLASVTLLSCLISGISLETSLLRGVLVLFLTYVIMLIFYICLNFIFRQKHVRGN